MLPSLKHNNPPSDAEILQNRLRDENAQSLQHAKQLIDAAERMPEIDSDDSAKKASDYIKQVMARRKALESARVNEKEPFLSLGRVVDGFFKSVTDQLDIAQSKAKRPLDAYLKAKEDENRRRIAKEAEDKRIAAEAQAAAAQALEAANRPQEAEAMMQRAATSESAAFKLEGKADAKPAEMARTRSDTGSVATLRTRTVGEITDIAQLDLETLRHHISPDALQKALNSFVSAGGRELRGAVIKEISEAVVR